MENDEDLICKTHVVGSVRQKLVWMPLKGYISCKQPEAPDVCEVRVSEPPKLHHPGAQCWLLCAEHSQGGILPSGHLLQQPAVELLFPLSGQWNY